MINPSFLAKPAFTIIALLILAGCATRFPDYTEPDAASNRARVRLLWDTNGNMLARYMPNPKGLRCMAPDTSTIVKAFSDDLLGKRNNKILGMPYRSVADRDTGAEYFVKTEPGVWAMFENITNVTYTGYGLATSGTTCGVSGGFTPEVGKDYEVRMIYRGASCSLSIEQLSEDLTGKVIGTAVPVENIPVWGSAQEAEKRCEK